MPFDTTSFIGIVIASPSSSTIRERQGAEYVFASASVSLCHFHISSCPSSEKNHSRRYFDLITLAPPAIATLQLGQTT